MNESASQKPAVEPEQRGFVANLRSKFRQFFPSVGNSDDANFGSFVACAKDIGSVLSCA